jgi:hypothetical protein
MAEEAEKVEKGIQGRQVRQRMNMEKSRLESEGKLVWKCWKRRRMQKGRKEGIQG